MALSPTAAAGRDVQTAGGSAHSLDVFGTNMHYKKLFCRLLPALLVAASCSTSASESLPPQDDPLLSEEDFLSELPAVLTATRLSQPAREAPAATTIIDRDLIRASGAREIADLFRLVPGFVVSHDNGYTPIVTYHGLSNEQARRMQVLVDGRSVYSVVFGGTKWTDLPLAIDDIERIEVIRGPNAATYGANAFLSTINIITRHSSETNGVFARVNVGNTDIHDGYLRYGDTLDELSYRLTLGYNHDTGFPDRYDSHQVRMANFRSDYQPSTSNTMEFQLGFNNGEMGVDSKILNAADEKNNKNYFAQIRWQHDLSTDENFSLQFYYIGEDTAQIYDVNIPVLGRVVANDSYKANRLDLEAQHIKQLPRDARIVWGGGIRRDSATAPGYFGTEAMFYNNLYRIFGNLEWHLTQKLLLNAGAMWEKTDLSGTDLAPRLGLNYLFNPVHSIRLTISHGTRSPTLAESKSNFRVPVYGSTLPNLPSQPADFVSTMWKGNENLEPETITSYELGYMASLPRQGFTLDIKVYQEELGGLIYMDENKVSDPTDYYDGSYQVSGNFGDATINGAETTVNYQPLKDTRFVLSHSYTEIKSTLPKLLPDQGNQTVPEQIFSFLAMQKFLGRVNGSLAYYYVSESDGLGSGKPIPAIRRLDLRLGLAFRGRKMRGEIAAIVQNALHDNDYIDWRNDNIFERRQYISLDVQFN
ncbi:MAG: TonB-dependent receptor [Gammaproteobacteria bacterium]|nr:TonB-dependent receptor [Gammaproteobacteria bacterium]